MKKASLKIAIGAVAVFFLVALAGCSSSDSNSNVKPADDGGQTPQDVVTYSVGGELTGLVDGDTVVLQLNGGQDLSLTADGNFTFAGKLNDGDSYQVTVAGQPDNCDCTIEGASGTISGADVADVKVRCRKWRYPADLADNLSPDSYDAQKAQVAVAGNGEAVIVWRQRYDNVSSHYRIFKAEYRQGQWSWPQDVSESISPFAYLTDNPQVAMDGDGNAIVVWQQYDNGRWQIFMAQYRNGQWTDFNFPERLSLAGQHAVNPQVAMNANGDAVVVWQQYDGASPNYYRIYKAEYRNGLWSRPSAFDDNLSPAGIHAYYPRVAMDGDGNTIVVWQQQDSINRWQVFKAEYRNGLWEKPQDRDDNISPDFINAYLPKVAMDTAGNAIIIWEQLVSSLRQVVMVEYRNGLWSDFDYPEPVSPFGRNADYQSRVAMSGSGQAAITWRQYDGANWQIYKSEYRNGVWERPDDISVNISPDGQDAENPQVVMDAAGNTVITWQQSDGANDQIYKSEYRFGAWTHQVDLNADNISIGGQDAERPALAMNPGGDALVAWQQNDGANLQIFKAEYCVQP